MLCGSLSFIIKLFFHHFPTFLQLDESTPADPKGTFVDYQTTVVKYSKAIAITAQEMVRNLARPD